MALEGLLDIRESIPASGDLSNSYRFYTIDGNGELAVPSAGDLAFVSPDAADADNQGEEVAIIIVGKTKVEAGATISKGDQIATDGSGTAAVATAASVDTTTSNGSEDVAGDQVLGIALEDASSGELFKMLAVSGGLV